MNINRIIPENKTAVRNFLRVPYELNQGDTAWFPALQSSVAFDLNPNHPFYEHSDAAFFTVGNENQPVGRIAVMENRNFNAFHHTQSAFFTHFDCADDPAAAGALLNAAAEWADKRRLIRLAGPFGFLQTDPRGMMVAGYGLLSSFSQPYSPPYYADLMQVCNFGKCHDFFSGVLEGGYRIPSRVLKSAAYVLKRSGMTIHAGGSRRNLRRIGREFLDIYKESGTASPTYYPLSRREEDLIMAKFSQTINPDFVHYLEKDGRICGVHMATPNYVAALRGKRGRLKRTAFFLSQRRKPREINISTTFLRQKDQGRGLNLVLYTACQNEALKTGCRRALVGPVAERNTATLSVLEKTGIDFNICHRVFERNI